MILIAALTDYLLIFGYNAAWRNHRLHHFKNEHLWHGATNNISDRVRGTNPEQSTVRRPRTARTLVGSDPNPSSG